ncbi:MAG: tripartite tricarboxylate transporter substrate binding protein [Acidihalobacter sp.]|jgi:tripartite-type tricarboxylate transporter receptor subunit TctC|uniref:tripartite tricarboxylate transporter substrate binding protein n=1 Tax=Acidihalobacter sp. TaxID=1872108 RepID=UPI00307ED039
MLSRKKALFGGIALTLSTLGLLPVAWAADKYPSRPVQYVIPFGPGGESDITARLQQPFFKKLTGEDLIISYKPGGGGAVGWSQLNGMKGDGYNIMGVNLPHIIIKPLMGNVGFKTSDITTVYMFEYTPDAILVRKDSPFKTLQDLIDYAKSHPGQLTFSGSGKGTANDLANSRFDDATGTRTTYIPFKGTGAAFTALMGGQVKAEWGYSTVAANHKSDVRMLAVATEKRVPLFPDVPTFKEKGIDMIGGTYRGIAVPKSTPEAMRMKVSDLIGRINADPEFQKKMENRGFVLIDVPYKKVGAFMRQKTKEYIRLGKAAGVIK